jgi:hypothetical protein
VPKQHSSGGKDRPTVCESIGMAGTASLIDLRNIYPADELRRRGFIYESVGRATKSE